MLGGHCLAVDPYFIIAKDPENAKLIQTGREIIITMPAYVVDIQQQIIKALSGNKVRYWFRLIKVMLMICESQR